MRVKAIKPGWDGLKRRKVGDLFSWKGPVKEDGTPDASWVEVCEESAEPEEETEGSSEGVSLQEIQNADRSKERADLMKRLDLLQVPYFKGAPVTKLRELLETHGK